MDNNLKYQKYNNFKLLKQFLIDNGCYYLYMFNIINRHKYESENLFNFITSKSVYCYINGVFAWSETKEGYDYWFEINYQWAKFMSKFYIKT